MGNYDALTISTTPVFGVVENSFVPVGNKYLRQAINFDDTSYMTQQQYYDLLGEIQPLVDNEKNEDLKNILAYSCYMLYKKSEIYVEEPPSKE